MEISFQLDINLSTLYKYFQKRIFQMEDFYRSWIKIQEEATKTNPEYTEFQEASNNSLQEENEIQDATTSDPTDLVYESEDFQLFVKKESHKKQKLFRLQDHLFTLRIKPKEGVEMPFLSNILDFLHAGFIHILDEIKKFYNPEEHNIAYLTLFQQPMSSGLNTGAFDLQDAQAAGEITDRILSMLAQYLLSNQSLTLNDSFQVFVKILSIDHMKYQKSQNKRYNILLTKSSRRKQSMPR